jgi:hypothetical protein
MPYKNPEDKRRWERTRRRKKRAAQDAAFGDYDPTHCAESGAQDIFKRRASKWMEITHWMAVGIASALVGALSGQVDCPAQSY